MKSTKYIVTSKTNLKDKYGSKFTIIEGLIKKLIASDKKKNIDTKLLFIDDASSAKKAGIKAVKSTTASNCKEAIDSLCKKRAPEYIAILGAQDIIPFVEMNNPAGDDIDDPTVPSDLPYACDTPFSKDIGKFTGPTRAVGRIPDIPRVGEVEYLQRVIQNIMDHKPLDPDRYKKYFAVSAKVWHKSTKLSLTSMFGHNADLLLSPVAAPKTGYTKGHLKPLTHFINCHGTPLDFRFYGQQGKKDFPTALDSKNLTKNIGFGTIVAAECCYGAELVDPSIHGRQTDGSHTLSVANAYMGNDAIAFVGSSTIAYGPADSQGLADLITQFFIKNVVDGMSTGSALLEARQRFISASGPDLDPFELKTLAQFYLLGDPSVRPAQPEEMKSKDLTIGNTTRNNRKKQLIKGLSLKENTAPSKKIADRSTLQSKGIIKKLLQNVKLKRVDRSMTSQVKPSLHVTGLQKKMVGAGAKFHTFMQLDKTFLRTNGNGKTKSNPTINRNYVLVVKEDQREILGWRVYVAK